MYKFNQKCLKQTLIATQQWMGKLKTSQLIEPLPSKVEAKKIVLIVKTTRISHGDAGNTKISLFFGFYVFYSHFKIWW